MTEFSFDSTVIDVDDILKPMREVLRRANEGDEFAEDALSAFLNMSAMFIARAERDDGEVVAELMQFIRSVLSLTLN